MGQIEKGMRPGFSPGPQTAGATQGQWPVHKALRTPGIFPEGRAVWKHPAEETGKRERGPQHFGAKLMPLEEEEPNTLLEGSAVPAVRPQADPFTCWSCIGPDPWEGPGCQESRSGTVSVLRRSRGGGGGSLCFCLLPFTEEREPSQPGLAFLREPIAEAGPAPTPENQLVSSRRQAGSGCRCISY